MISVWPLWLQLSIWWISFILLSIIFTLIAVRYVVFIFFYSAGINVWICPFLFDDKKGFIESFLPIVQVKKREDMGVWVAIRFLAAACVIGTCVYLYMYPENLYGRIY